MPSSLKRELHSLLFLLFVRLFLTSHIFCCPYRKVYFDKPSEDLRADILSFYSTKFSEQADDLERIYTTHRRLSVNLKEKEDCVKRGQGFNRLPCEIVEQILELASY